MENIAIQLVDPLMAEGVTGRRHLSSLLLAEAVKTGAESLTEISGGLLVCPSP